MTTADRISALLARYADHRAELAALRGAPDIEFLFTGQRVAALAAYPRARHVNWAHLSLTWDTPEPSPAGGVHPYDIPPGNYAAFGRACRTGGVRVSREGELVPLVAGAPVMVDFEAHYTPATPHQWGQMRDLIRAMRSELAAGQKVVLYGAATFADGVIWQTLWNDGHGPSPAFAQRIVDGYAPYQILFDEVDAVVIDFCVLTRETGLASLGGDKFHVDLVRRASGKPVWGLVDPNYRMEQAVRLPPDVAAANLAAARAACDAVVYWGGLDDWRATYGAEVRRNIDLLDETRT
jgi:hypothetical protein